MGEILFRPMTKADVPAVHQLEVASFRSPWSQRSLLGECKNKLAHYGVLDDAGEIIAYGGMWIIFEEAHVTNIAVAPQRRRQGLGRRLMKEMIALAIAKGAAVMTLEVRETNYAAQELYRQCGFVQAGVRKNYYSDTGEAAYILWNENLLKTGENLANPPKSGL